jgi:hypothetical protein
MKELWSHGGYQKISEEGAKSQAMCGKVSIPAGSPERALHEAVKMKPKLAIMDAPPSMLETPRMWNLPRKATGNVWSLPKRDEFGLQLARPFLWQGLPNLLELTHVNKSPGT